MEIGKGISKCSFIPMNYPKTRDSTGKYRAYSVCIFRPPTNRNNKLKLYLESLHKCAGVLKQKLPGWIMRIYYDNSLSNDIFRKDKYLADYYLFKGTGRTKRKRIVPLIKRSNVQMILVKCPSHFYQSDEQQYVANHIGMFGSLMRYHAAFDPDVSYMVSRDADFAPDSVAHNAKYIKQWVQSGKRYSYLHSPRYAVPHGGYRETMFAGTWGMKGTWPESLWNKLFTVFTDPASRFHSVRERLIDKLSDMIEGYRGIGPLNRELRKYAALSKTYIK